MCCYTGYAFFVLSSTSHLFMSVQGKDTHEWSPCYCNIRALILKPVQRYGCCVNMALSVCGQYNFTASNTSTIVLYMYVWNICLFIICHIMCLYILYCTVHPKAGYTIQQSCMQQATFTATTMDCNSSCVVIAACGVIVAAILKRRANRLRCKNRAVWVKEWVKNRDTYGVYQHLFESSSWEMQLHTETF